MAGFDHQTIDQKWQAYWTRERTFATPTDRTRPKYYVLDMFPYPSGDGLHVGHPKGYTATDIVARAKRMMGFNVLRVMGWDSFGLPAERRAERTGEHPSVITARNIATFKSQLQKLGLSYDWSASSRRAIRNTTNGRSGSSRSCSSAGSRIAQKCR